MSSQVPSITVLRERATQLLGRGCVRGQLKAMMAGAFAAKNAGTPLDPESTSQELVTQCQGLINQADQDVLAILVRELLEFVENGGGGGGDAPAVIAPFPGIGAEGEYYAQQIRTTGATPQTFSLATGSFPDGTSIDPETGIISGLCSYPNGGLYQGFVTITNDQGSTDYGFEILINGTLPTLSYDVTVGAFPIGSLFVEPSAVTTFNATATGSSGGTTAFPLYFQLTTPVGDANMLVDSATGQLTLQPSNDANGNSYPYTVTLTNYFGSTTFSSTIYVLAPIYWGEWHGSLPSEFSEADILSGLFNDTTPGPRVIEGEDVYTLLVGNPVYYPSTAIPYFRVLAVPRGFTNGNLAQSQGDGSDLQPAGIGGLAEFDPPWPAAYQDVLSINGIPYDVYVYAIGATTGPIDLFYGQNFSPNAPLIRTTTGDHNQFIIFAGQNEFLADSNPSYTDTKIQVETYLGIGPFTWSTTGTLPTGLSWNSLTQQITGTPTDGSQVFERFVFSITATNAGGVSNTLTLYIAVSAPVYSGELSGSLPDAFTASDITSGLLNVTTPGPRITLTSTYSSTSTPVTALVFPKTSAIITRVFAVPSKFFNGSWPQDPAGVGATRIFTPYLYQIWKWIFTDGVPTNPYYNPEWPIPYQSGLSIDSSGIPCAYDVYVIEDSGGLQAYWI